MQSIYFLKEKIKYKLIEMNIHFGVKCSESSITVHFVDFKENIQFVLESYKGWNIFITNVDSLNTDSSFIKIYKELEEITYSVNDVFYPLDKELNDEIKSDKESFLNILIDKKYVSLIKNIRNENHKIDVELIDYFNHKPKFSIKYLTTIGIWAFVGEDMVEDCNIIDKFYDLFQEVNNRINFLNANSDELFI